MVAKIRHFVQTLYRHHILKTPKLLILRNNTLPLVRVRVPLSAHNISDLAPKTLYRHVQTPHFVQTFVQTSKHNSTTRAVGPPVLVSRIECSTIRLINVDCCMKERVIYGSRMWKADNVWFFQEIRWSQRLGLQGVHQSILLRW